MNSIGVPARPTQKIWDYAWTFATTFGCLLLGLATATISARLLGPAGRGELAALLYFPALMASLFVLGLPQAITYEIAKYPGRALSITCAGLCVAAVTSVVGALFFCLLIPYMLTPDKRYLVHSAQLVCLVAFSCGFNAHLYAVARGYARFILVNKAVLCLAAGNLLVILFLSFRKLLTSLSAALAMQLLQACAMVLLLFSLKRSFLPFCLDWHICRGLIVRGARLFLPATALLIYSMLDRGILLRTVTIEQIGFYSVAFTVASPITLAVDPINQICFVELSREHQAPNYRALFLARFHLGQFIVLAAFLAISVLAKPTLFLVFGAQFTKADAAVHILCGALACQAMAKLVDGALRSADHLSPVIYANALAAIFLVTASIPLIHYAQLAGFCIAFLLAELLRFALLSRALCERESIQARSLWGLRADVALLILSQIHSLIAHLNPQRSRCRIHTP